MKSDTRKNRHGFTRWVMISLEDESSRKYTAGSSLDDSRLGTLEGAHQVKGSTVAGSGGGVRKRLRVESGMGRGDMWSHSGNGFRR